MNAEVACRTDDLTKATAEQVWQKLLLGGGGTYEVAWDSDAAVTPMGSRVYFTQYLNTGGCWMVWCRIVHWSTRVAMRPGSGP